MTYLISCCFRRSVKCCGQRIKVLERVSSVLQTKKIVRGIAGKKRVCLLKNKMGDEGAKVVAKDLEANTTLESIEFIENEIGAKGARALAKALEINRTLKELKFGYNKITDEGAKAFATMLEANTALEGLNVEDTFIPDEGVKALAGGLIKNTTLKELHLGRKIGEEGAKAFAEMLVINTTLERLSIRETKIGDKGAKALVGGLIKNTTLKVLILSGNRIADEGAKALAGGLIKNTTLKALILSGNRIADEGARALAKALKINTVLKNLDLRYNFPIINFHRHFLDEGVLAQIKSYIQRNRVLDAMQKEDKELVFRLLKNVSQKERNSWIEEKNEIKAYFKKHGITDINSFEMECLKFICKAENKEGAIGALLSVNFKDVKNEEVQEFIIQVKKAALIQKLDNLNSLIEDVAATKIQKKMAMKVREKALSAETGES